MNKIINYLINFFKIIGLIFSVIFLTIISWWPMICIWLIICFLLALITYWLGWVFFGILLIFLIIYLIANLTNSY